MTPPPLSLPFRIATYYTLLMACLALGYSEWDLVPESIAFTAVVVISLIVSFFLEGKFALGLGKANLLGLGIGAVAVVWLAVKLTKLMQPANSALANLSWPASLLPYMGPLVMILIPAKLFRPKHVGDWWTMQGIGLVTVVLASSMTDDPFFIVLVFLYAGGAVWSLSLFFSNRATGAIPPLPGQAQTRPQVLAGGDGERGLWWHALLWLGAASVIALPVFFLSPRSTGERWAFTKTRLETGYNPENTHDMSKIGDLETSSELAFEVVATNRDGTPKPDLDPSQLWRGTSYSEYEDGKWNRKGYASGHSVRFGVAQFPAEYRPPDFGPQQYELAFQCGEKVAGPVLASPIFWAERQESPVSSTTNGTVRGWPAIYDGSFIPNNLGPRVNSTYTQRSRVSEEADLGPAMEPFTALDGGFGDPQRSLLTRMPVARIREWAVVLLKASVASGRLPRGAIDTADARAGFVVHPEFHERVARAFRDHFLDSGEFEYTTKLRRSNKKIDPIEEFLWNTKAGHCERFAAGLALSLRALGIPAQFVVGFKGYEWHDEGKYIIRQEHAHAWVEILVQRTAPAGFAFRNPEAAKAGRVWHWLNLDPTPGTLAAPPSAGSWFDNARQKSVSFVNDFIIGYNPAKREQAVRSIKGGWLEWTVYLAAALVLPVGFVALRRFTRRRPIIPAGPITGLPWYRQYIAALKSHGLNPSVGQTPKEFADAATAYLRTVPAAAASAVPAFVTSKLYRVRYAGSALTPTEETEVAAAVATLVDALKTTPIR